MCCDQILDISWIYLHATPIDDIFHATGDAYIPIHIDNRQVAGLKKVILGKCISICLSIVQIARHHRIASDFEFPLLAGFEHLPALG